ncbi:ERAP1-like C-terminal domain-containing protein, partial [Streptomyces sp. WAC08241]|uniref:ERAP1-like C-terminal domain-containing protein n=1 Tax=Streptomyces sp. WAC08241 TaxID=2487421 RepID=UPI0021B08866
NNCPELTGRLCTAPCESASVPGTNPSALTINNVDLSITGNACVANHVKPQVPHRHYDKAAAVTGALRGLSRIPDPLTRAVVWNALRDRVRDGDLAPADYLEVALAHLPEETELALVQGVLAFARHQIADRYVPAGERPAALATICGIARALLRRTEDGEAPGLRLTAVRAFVDSATTPDKIASWLDEGTVHGGPELDPELRWRILARLAVLGATDETAIAAELERDPSATGQEGAARCRAALPAPEAKEAAWSALFDSDDLSNYLFTATAQGFWQPEQADLVREYVPRFYEAAAALGDRRGPAMAEAAGRHAFPAHAVDADSLALGERHLADTPMIPALRRKLVDQLDDLRRALKVREG